MTIVRCKACNKEISNNTVKAVCCGCPNMTTVTKDKVSALDLSQVIMVESERIPEKINVLTKEDLEFQEQRKRRKVRKLDFEIR